MSNVGDPRPVSRKRAEKPAPIDATTETSVAAYLTAHPDFMERHSGLLRTLAPPSVDRGNGVVDFQRFMVARLQGDLDQLHGENNQLIHTARANAHSQARIHSAVLKLVETRSLGQLLDVLTSDLMDVLDVDVIAMAVESSNTDLPRVTASGLRIVPPGSVDEWLGRKDVVLRSAVAGDPAIYGPGAGLIQSEALLRLTVGGARTPAGLVAFGSRDPNLFHEGQGTELIAFLGGVLQRLLRGWIEQPS